MSLMLLLLLASLPFLSLCLPLLLYLPPQCAQWCLLITPAIAAAVVAVAVVPYSLAFCAFSVTFAAPLPAFFAPLCCSFLLLLVLHFRLPLLLCLLQQIT